MTTSSSASLANVIVAITGVSSGLGHAMACEALDRGATVVGTVRQQIDLDDFEAIAPGRAIGRLLEMTDTARVDALGSSIESDIGPVDVLINNAGYGLAGTIEEVSMGDLRRQFEVAVFAPVAMIQSVLPAMRARRRGHIINIASMGSVVTFPTNGAYHGAKFALLGIGDTLAKEVAPLGVKVTTILPGLYNTDWGGRSRALSDHIGDYDPLYTTPRPDMSGDPARLARVVLDLLDDADPPTRLLVGASAVLRVREELTRQLAAVDRWETISATDGNG